MVNAAVIVSASLLVIGITVAAFMVLKAQYDAKDGNYNTVGEICADLEGTIEPQGEVARLCKDFGAEGADVGLDDPIICSQDAKDESFEYMGTVEDYTGPMFTMREILEADDVQAKYDEVEIRCASGRRQLALRGSAASSGRDLLVDYGWCSINAGFITGLSSDSSDYCNPNQSCDSWGGCGGSLSSCCIVHDKCLQSTSATSRCQKTDCKGKTCDKNLASCAWGVSCSYKWKCGWWKCWGYDVGCGVASTAVTAAMGGVVPQANWNTGGANTHTCCDGSC